mgnify:CR=1 FL=1
MRHAYRRPLEQWLVLEQCLLLEEHGYDVELRQLCDKGEFFDLMIEKPHGFEPGAALRRAYVAAADEAARRGTPTVLVVNDLDAGVARFRDDKVTVNNQMVLGTLMNICDTPKRVSVGQVSP